MSTVAIYRTWYLTVSTDCTVRVINNVLYCTEADSHGLYSTATATVQYVHVQYHIMMSFAFRSSAFGEGCWQLAGSEDEHHSTVYSKYYVLQQVE